MKYLPFCSLGLISRGVVLAAGPYRNKFLQGAQSVFAPGVTVVRPFCQAPSRPSGAGGWAGTVTKPSPIRTSGRFRRVVCGLVGKGPRRCIAMRWLSVFSLVSLHHPCHWPRPSQVAMHGVDRHSTLYFLGSTLSCSYTVGF